jgi:hypothetical protein
VRKKIEPLSRILIAHHNWTDIVHPKKAFMNGDSAKAKLLDSGFKHLGHVQLFSIILFGCAHPSSLVHAEKLILDAVGEINSLSNAAIDATGRASHFVLSDFLGAEPSK